MGLGAHWLTLVTLVAPWRPFRKKLSTQLQTLTTWGTALKSINVLMASCEITKTGTLAMTLHKPEGEANPHVRFGYGPLKIWNHTQGQVSGSMNADPMNIIHTSQQYKENMAWMNKLK